jgi:hypothetical protein
MATPYKTYTLLKSQEITIDLNQVYINDYEAVRDVYLNYEDNFVIGIFYNSINVLPNWATITQTSNINTLDYNLSTSASLYPYQLYNGTDYIKELKIKIDTAGTYELLFVGFFYKGYVSGRYINYTFTFNVVEPPPPPPPLVYNNAGIVYNKYDRVIRVEKNKTTEVSFGTDGLFPNGEQLIINSTLPAWITNNTIASYTQFWTLAPTSTGTFYYNASAYLRNSFEGIAAITVIVVDSLFEEINNCCSDENVNIVWLNRQGGRGNFIFTQRKDFNVEIAKKSTYLTNDIKRYSEIKNVHNGFKVYSTGLSLNQIDFLDTLRYSIQCWQYINGVFIPLILDIGSFEKYNTKENMYEISMNFLYAERLNIQRQ